MNQTTVALIEKYYKAFNEANMTAFLDLLTDDVIHDINQGTQQIGKEAFKKFMDHMNNCYKEKASDLVIMATDDCDRAAAEFMIEGTYIKTDKGLPEARGQDYKLPVGAFFTIKNNKITRVTNYYNLQEWLKLIEK